MATIGLFFAPIAPLVSVAAMVVFWISSWVYKYQLMFVFVSRVETGGVSIAALYSFCTVPDKGRTASVERRHQQVALCHYTHATHHVTQYVARFFTIWSRRVTRSP